MKEIFLLISIACGVAAGVTIGQYTLTAVTQKMELYKDETLISTHTIRGTVSHIDTKTGSMTVNSPDPYAPERAITYRITFDKNTSFFLNGVAQTLEEDASSLLTKSVSIQITKRPQEPLRASTVAIL